MKFCNFFGSFLIFNLLIFKCLGQNDTIELDLINLLKPFKGKVGVSILNLKTNDRIDINGNDKFPMQSVYKFPLALSVFDQIDKGNLKLDQILSIKKSDLLPDTYSPMRDKYPEGKTEISLKEILDFTVSDSDNNGCDFLFRLMGGTKKVNDYIENIGISNIAIVGTEAEMHNDAKVQYANFSTPFAMTNLLQKFYSQKILTKKSTEDLWKMMLNGTTGSKKLRANLPNGTIIGHKSGWSGADSSGFTSASNDVGIIILPSGNAIAISVFVSDTFEKTENLDALIANISKLAFDFYSKNK